MIYELYLYTLSMTVYIFFKLTGLLHKKKLAKINQDTKILFIRLDKLGDMCITVPYLKEVKSYNPRTELTLLCSKSNAQFLSEVQDFFDLELYDKLIVWDPPWRENKYRLLGLVDFFSLIKQVFKMWKEHYSIVVQPVLMGIETLFSLLIKSDRVFSCIDVEMPLSRLLGQHLDFKVERHGNRNFHLSDNVIETIRNLERLKSSDLQQVLAPFHRQHELGCSHRQRQIVINVSAGNSRRNLPYKHVKFVLDHIFKNYKNNTTVSLIGTGDDVGMSEALASEYDGVNNLVGKTSFTDLFELLEAADLLVTSDTGTMHIGSLMNVFMVCVFGPGLVPFCRPVSNNCVIVKKELGCSGCMDFCHTDEIPPPCLKEIDPNLITLEIDRYLLSRD